jgi:hypothetical protein
MTTLYLAVAVALGLAGCVDEDTAPVPPTEDEDVDPGEQDPGVPVDPPGEWVPGKGDGCGAQLRDDGSCSP